MSDYNLADQLELAARIIREDLPWEVYSDLQQEWIAPTDSVLTHFRCGRIIRIKPAELPPLPPGKSWWCASELTEEMIREGWRPMYLGEYRGKPHQYKIGDLWKDSGIYPEDVVSQNSYPLRTKATLPAPQPLSAPDVIPGDAIRATGSTEAHLILDVYPHGITAGRAGTELSWERLMADFEIRDRESGAWVACSKEVES